jgi:hypothetical protein
MRVLSEPDNNTLVFEGEIRPISGGNEDWGEL